jgi:hexosaminidase
MVLTSWSTTGIFNPVFNTGYDIIEDYPRGHRYPFTGSNMLLQAFFESVNKTVPLNISDFISRYGRQTFGFTQAQTASLWRAINCCGYEIRQGKVMSAEGAVMPGVTIKQMLDSTLWAAQTLRTLKPIKGTTEYAHLQLMTDLRVQYLECYLIENRLNESTFNENEYPAMAVRLKAILTKSADLDRRFIALNKDALYLAELQAENKVHNTHIQVLYDRVSKNRSMASNTPHAAH